MKHSALYNHKRKLCSTVAVCLTLWSSGAPGQESASSVLGQMAGVFAMVRVCKTTFTDQQTAKLNAEGPRVQKASGISEEDFSKLISDTASEIKEDDCEAIRANFGAVVDDIIRKAASVP